MAGIESGCMWTAALMTGMRLDGARHLPAPPKLQNRLTSFQGCSSRCMLACGKSGGRNILSETLWPLTRLNGASNKFLQAAAGVRERVATRGMQAKQTTSLVHCALPAGCDL